MTACESFGAALRQERERRGLTLAAVSARTKISPHLLRSLERGDVSRWPGGIYRRAFVRAYATTVGLAPEPTLEEFVSLFPEPGRNPPALPGDESGGLRLTLVKEPRWKAPALRSAAAVVDAGGVVLAAYVVSTLADAGFWTSAALAGLAWHAIAAVVLGRSPGVWLVASGVALRQPEPMRDQFAALRLGWLGPPEKWGRVAFLRRT
jgi:transcriptional regulator with XRE-family HTH domain